MGADGSDTTHSDGLARDAWMLRATLMDAEDAIVVVDVDGRILLLNAAAARLLGRGDVGAKPEDWSAAYEVYYADGVTPLPVEKIPLYRAMQGDTVEHYEICIKSPSHPNGVWADCNARPIRDEGGGIRGAFVSFRDINELKLMQREMEERLKQRLKEGRLLRSLLDHLDVVVWAIDEQGMFTFHDGKAVVTAGLKPGDYIGKSTYELFPGQDQGFRSALAGEMVRQRMETHGVFWDHWFIPQRNAQGNLEGVIGMSQDITEINRTMTELETKLTVIEKQQEVIRNLETPVIQVWDHVLTLPMVGIVDSRRAARVMDDLLEAVTRIQARFAIIDLTGVDVVDTATAGYLLSLVKAVSLLGAEGIITGIRPNVAQTMISLGLDLSKVKTLANLREGLKLCVRKISADSSKKAAAAP